ncbi:MAG: sigma 54-interacting transcriptional regulator [Thermoguttaceae bacterium]
MERIASSILIVEDEQIVAVDVESVLEQIGYRVAGIAATSEEACRMAVETKPDLVLMDVRIDGPIDGIETARQIRQLLDVPIVFLTAYTDAETLDRAKQIGPCGYLVKPFAQRDLQATLEIALEKGAIDRRLRKNHQDLLAILDAQRHGTIMLDGQGRICFASRAVQSFTPTDLAQAAGGLLENLLPFSEEDATAIAEMSRRSAEERSNVPAVLQSEDEPPRHAEIEIVDDPRNPERRILFLYDTSPLYLLRQQLDQQAAFQNMLGKSKPMRQVFQLIEELAAVDSTVLIEGETGTGKELVARAIHQLSPRRDGPFLALNCGGLSQELAASQLFGHRRGAFTGAVEDQRGLFEAASGGTLFLDEVGELPMRVQTSLLRVLEENAVLPIGESTLRPVNIRLLAATHLDLAEESLRNRFRQDLLYRIRVARVTLPPLRQRREDLPLLVRAFVAAHRASTGKQVHAVDDDAMALLLDHSWPGNVRELRNALEFAVVRCRGTVIQPVDLPPELLQTSPEPPPDMPASDEADRIAAAIKWARGNRTRAANLLGISRATLYRRLKELGIENDGAPI